ncbi:Gfo/Idh/MocA family oxidoreductase [Ruminococcaceae bacterium OttesenSCG-928-L11]|nr:Gfo/Idh/MocA family oxidoreductase [Ruminococcaceae bacterium OttesenSCG-928-L11]
MAEKPIQVAMIGVGAISGIYLKNIGEVFPGIALIGVCDLVRERAEKAQREYGIPKLYETMHDAFADPEVDIVLNLTRPYEHFEVTKAALNAGKHVYSEKPLGATWEEGKALAALAEEKKLALGGAPDTFLGAGIQTCRRLIDSGMIGTPIGAAAFMIGHGPESWHPGPAFFYKRGGGPMMDMGPYYVTALINLLGGVKGITGSARAAFPQRTITSLPHRGTVVDVETPTYVTGILEFASGITGTLFTTFDVHYKGQARFEIYGSEGTLLVPDPNFFGGPIRLLRPEEGELREMPLLFDYKENSRGLGLADMARALQTGRAARADYHQTLHVLEILTAFERSSDEKRYLPLTTTYERGLPMKNNPIHGLLD